MTEIIRSLHVDEEEIHTGGDFIYNLFVQCKDAAFYMATDRINDLTCERVTGGLRAEAVLACQDRSVRVISGSELLCKWAWCDEGMAHDMSHSIRRGLMNASAEEAVPWLAVLKAWLTIPDGLNGSRAEEIFGDGKVDYGGKVTN